MKFSLALTLSNIFEPSNEQSESYLKTLSVLYYESDFPVRKMGTLTRYALYVWPGLPGWEWQSGDLVTGEVSQIDHYMIHFMQQICRESSICLQMIEVRLLKQICREQMI